MRKLLLCFVASLLLAGCQEQANNDRDPEEQQYCEMVARWHADAAEGIKPKHRRGWPPFKGECPK
jgi:uncharacterized protein YcfL